jgi:hypothetical protein
MDPLGFLFDKSLGALIGLLVGYGARVSQERVTRLRGRRTIRAVFGLRGKSLIIHSAIHDTERRAYAYPSCDTRVARIVAALFDSLSLKEGVDFAIGPDIHYSSPDGGIATARGANLVLICGPKRNAMTRFVLQKTPDLRYQLTVDPKSGENALYDRHLGDFLVPRWPAATGIPGGQDYGLIQAFPNPFSLNNTVVIIAGVHGAGTLAAGQWLSEANNLAELARRKRAKIIETVVVGCFEHDPELLTTVSEL